MPRQSKKTTRRAKPTQGKQPTTVPPSAGNPAPLPGDPHFAEPTPGSDPTRFINRKSDEYYYKYVIKNLLAIPAPRDPSNLTLSLERVYGSQGPAKMQAITKSGQIVFHAVGDTGSILGPQTIEKVADKMVGDFTESNPADIPSFFYHLGDLVYSFGETQYYYDQFYDPYRGYNAPIFAIAGNHDGMSYQGDRELPLAAFLRNFCATSPQKTPEAGNLWRTAMIQPGIYFALDAPFVRIIGLFSNVLEDPGVISSEGNTDSPVTNQQLQFLSAELLKIKQENFQGAVILAVHHPPFTGGANHGGSPRMLQDIDEQCQKAGVYPHAVLSGHAHNYQRYTRSVQGRETPYVVAGCGGHNIAGLTTGKDNTPVRTPLRISDELTLQSYFDDYGYMRIVVTANLLRIEFHSVGTGLQTKSAFDVCTVDLKTHRLTTSHP